MANLSNINGYFNVTDTGLVNVVNGGLYVTKSSGDAIIGIISSGGNGRPYYLRSNTNGNFAIYDDTACLERLIIASGGNATFSKLVGVGGKTPAYGLSLAQGTAVENKIAWTDGTPNFAASIYANSSTDKLTFATKNSSNVETVALEIDTSQNATFAGQVHIDSKPNSGLAYNVLIDVGSSGDGTIGYQTVDQLAANLAVSSSSNWVKSGNDIYNTNSGNVGIGTTLPNYKLEVAGTIGTQDRLAIQQTYFGYSSAYKVVQYGETGSTKAISLGYNPVNNTNGGFSGNEILIPNNIRILSPNAADDQYYGVMMFDSNDKLLIGSSNYLIDSNYIMAMDPATQRVGIGTINPGYKLDVTNVGADAINVNANNDFTGIRWSSTQHTYSWRVGSDNFFIYDVVNGAQRVTLDASGNVGINYISPFNQISGANETTLAISNSNVASLYLNNTATNGHNHILFSGTGGALSFYDKNRGDYNMVIDSSGLVSLTESLQIADTKNLQFIGSSGDHARITYTQGNGTTGDNWGFTFYQNSGSAAAIDFFASSEAAGNGNIRFATAGTERMRITDIGNVAINYTNQGIYTYGGGAYAGKIIAQATGNDVALACINRNTSGSTGGNEAVSISFVNEFTTGQYNWLGKITLAPTDSWTGTASTRNADMLFSTNNAGIQSEKMRIKSGGSVGINDTNPLAMLSVISNNSTYPTQTIINHSGGADGYVFQRWQYVSGNTGYRCDIKQKVTSGVVRYAFDLVNNGVAHNNNLVLDRGKVGIGTQDPIYTFHVKSSNNVSIFEDTSGSSGAAFCLFNAPSVFSMGSITRNGTANSVLFNTGSDYRLKEDLQDFNALDLVNNITAYDYKWKDTDQRDYGFVAHELQEIIPNIVTGEKDGERMQSVDYSKLTPVLLKAIQELKAEIETLKTQINN